MIGELPTLEYVDIDVNVDRVERLSDEEIVAVNNQLNPVLDDNESRLEMYDETESEPIPSAKQTIQAIDCIKRSLVMDDTSATEEVLR